MREEEDYKQRSKNIENKSETKRSELLTRKKYLEEGKIKISSRSIPELLMNKERIFFENIISESKLLEGSKNESIFSYLLTSRYFDLLLLLVREELINEKYSDYITYFHEGNLHQTDKDFVRSIYDRSPKDINYILTKPEDVLENISLNDFIGYEVKNISLYSKVLENSKVYSEYLIAIINILKNTQDIGLLYKFYEESKLYSSTLMESLNNVWPNHILEVIGNSNITNNAKHSYVSTYIKFSPNEIIEKIDSEEQLIDFINESKVLEMEYFDEVELLENLPKLKKWGIQFENITLRNIRNQVSSEKIFDKLVEFNLFKMNRSNIYEIAAKYTKDKFNSEYFLERNYSLIKGIKNDIVSNVFFDERLPEYFEAYLDFGNKNLSDAPNDVVELLNNDRLIWENKINYISRLNLENKIEDIFQIKEKALWDMLTSIKILDVTSKNIVSLIENNEWKLNDNIVELINSSDNEILFVSGQYGENLFKKIFETIVMDENILDEKYISILKSIELRYKNGVPTGLQQSRLVLLVQHKIIEFNETTLADVRKNFRNLLSIFICSNLNIYLELVGENENGDFDTELQTLLESKVFSDDEMLELIKKVHGPVVIRETNFSDKIINYILENKFSSEDLKYVFENYANFSKSIQITINNKILEKVSYLYGILNDVSISLESRQILFADKLNMLPLERVIEMIDKLKLEPELKTVLKNRKVKISKNTINRLIINNYLGNGWITKIETDEEANKYIVRGRKILK